MNLPLYAPLLRLRRNPWLRPSIKKLRVKTLKQLAYTERKKNISRMFKTLENQIPVDSHNGYDEQHETMVEIVDEMLLWVHDAFLIGVEEGVEFEEVNRCLLFMWQIIEKLLDCHSQCVASLFAG